MTAESTVEWVIDQILARPYENVLFIASRQYKVTVVLEVDQLAGCCVMVHR